MSVIDDVEVGDVRFTMGWNLFTPTRRTMNFCEIRLERQTVLVKDHVDLRTGTRTARIAPFLRTVALGLVERERAADDFPRSWDALDWLEKTLAEVPPGLSYTAFMANRTDESFGVQTYIMAIDAMVAELGLAPHELGTIADAARRLRTAADAGFDFDRVVVRNDATELAWHPGERRADGGHAIWLRVRHEGQAVYGQLRFGPRGRPRGPDHEAQLAEALEKGVVMALDGGMFLMDARDLQKHLGEWIDRAGEQARFDQLAEERVTWDFQSRWVAGELRNTLHRFGEGRATNATLSQVHHALTARTRTTLPPFA